MPPAAVSSAPFTPPRPEAYPLPCVNAFLGSYLGMERAPQPAGTGGGYSYGRSFTLPRQFACTGGTYPPPP